MSTQKLTLDLPEKTVKKLKALAMLSGVNVPELEAQLAEYFDSMLTQNIADILADMDGKALFLAPSSNGAQKTAEVVSDEPTQESFEGHSLSEDSMPESVKSAADEEEELQAKAKQAVLPKPGVSKKAAPPVEEAALDDEEDDGIKPFQINAADVGNDAEAFLDAAMEVQPVKQKKVTKQGRYTTATKGFNPKQRRAKIIEFTGDETVDTGDWFQG